MEEQSEDLSVCGTKQLRLKEVYDVTIAADGTDASVVATFRSLFVDYEYDRGQPNRYTFQNGVTLSGDGFTAVLVVEE